MSDDRDFLERSLADLELERAAGDLADDDYADLKARYEARLTRSGPSATPERASAWGQKLVWVVVVAVVGVGAGLGVAQWSGAREPGEQVSGGLPSTSSEQLAEAARLFQAGEISEAIAVYQSVLDENPEDVEALTYFGWMLRNVGNAQDDEQLQASGVNLIERALEVDPDFAEGWLFRGIIFLRDEDDPERAVDALRLALAGDPIPEIEAAARELLAEIAQQS